MTGRHLWIDASAGIAGDMLLGALVDAGAPLTEVQRAVDAVVPGAVRLTVTPVLRAGLRATKLDVDVLTADQPERHWSTIQNMITGAALADPVRDRALATFQRLATAEARVHGVSEEEVHFHEVGALDSIADIVGVCAALHALEVDTLSTGTVAVGSGTVRTAHGRMPVPVPAVVELAAGRQVLAGGDGELTTPTGMALVVALTDTTEDLPPLELVASGSGAGSRDTPDRANVTRVLLGTRVTDRTAVEQLLLLEANVDDLDPRLWPGVLTRLIGAGAADAWLVPIVMKKGRPAHILSVLTHPDRASGLRELILTETTTFGVRETAVERTVLARGWVDVAVADRRLPVKIAHRDGLIAQVTPEFDELDRAAAELGRSVHALLSATAAAADTAGLVIGAPVPELRGRREPTDPDPEPGTAR